MKVVPPESLGDLYEVYDPAWKAKPHRDNLDFAMVYLLGPSHEGPATHIYFEMCRDDAQRLLRRVIGYLPDTVRTASFERRRVSYLPTSGGHDYHERWQREEES